MTDEEIGYSDIPPLRGVNWTRPGAPIPGDEEEDAEDRREAEDELLAIRAGRSRAYPLEVVMRAHGNLEG